MLALDFSKLHGIIIYALEGAFMSLKNDENYCVAASFLSLIREEDKYAGY